MTQHQADGVSEAMIEAGAHAIALVCSVSDRIGDIPTQRKYARAVIAALAQPKVGDGELLAEIERLKGELHRTTMDLMEARMRPRNEGRCW